MVKFLFKICIFVFIFRKFRRFAPKNTIVGHLFVIFQVKKASKNAKNFAIKNWPPKIDWFFSKNGGVSMTLKITGTGMARTGTGMARTGTGIEPECLGTGTGIHSRTGITLAGATAGDLIFGHCILLGCKTPRLNHLSDLVKNWYPGVLLGVNHRKNTKFDMRPHPRKLWRHISKNDIKNEIFNGILDLINWFLSEICGGNALKVM